MLSFFLLIIVVISEEAVTLKVVERLISAGSSLNPLFPTAAVFGAVCVGAKVLELLVFLILVLQGQSFGWFDCCPSLDCFFQELKGPCGSAEDISNVPEAGDFSADLLWFFVEYVPEFVKGYCYA